MRWISNISRSKREGILSAELFTVAMLSLISTMGFARITTKLVQNKLNPFRTDIRLMNFLSSLESPGMTLFMKAVTSLCSVQVLPFIAGTFAYRAIKKGVGKYKSFEIPVISIGSALLNLLFKVRFKRTRPLQNEIKVSGWSYPSGHAMESMSFYGFLLYELLKKRKPSFKKFSLGALLSSLIVLIGVSRSYLKVHFPSDVVAGYALGFLWLISSLIITRGTEYLALKKYR